MLNNISDYTNVVKFGQLLEELGKFPDLAKLSIEYLETIYFINLINKEHWDEQDFQFLNYITIGAKVSVLADNIYNLVSCMSNMAREKSHGASILNRVLVPKKLYDLSFKEVNAACIYISKVKIEQNPISNDIIGVCKPKFDYVPIEMLTIIGRINNE